MIEHTQVDERGFVLPPERVLGPPGTALPPAEPDGTSDRPERIAAGSALASLGLRSDQFDAVATLLSKAGREIDESIDELGRMAVRSASAALARQQLRPDQVDALVVASVTGFRMPGLDVHLINELGLRPNVRRKTSAQMGCVGGVWALSEAWEQAYFYPGSRVLVVVADAFSLGLQHTDADRAAFIYKGLAGDLVGALVVHSDDGPGLRLEHTVQDPPFTHLLPHTSEYYRSYTDALGVHFTSLEDGPEAVAKLIPEIAAWLGNGTAGPWPLDFVISHTGAPKILNYVADGLMLTEHDLRHSWASLRERGNTTAVSVIDVLERTYADPPEPGTRGAVLAFGPGVAGGALKVSWS